MSVRMEVEHIESPGYRTVLRNMNPIVKPDVWPKSWRETVRANAEEALKRRGYTFHTGGPA